MWTDFKSVDLSMPKKIGRSADRQIADLIFWDTLISPYGKDATIVATVYFE